MDYAKALKDSSKPYLILQQAYAASASGSRLPVQMAHKLVKEYSPDVLATSINALQRKKVDNPLAYFLKVCQNVRNSQPKPGIDLNKEVDLYRAEQLKSSKPVLRSPFDVATT